MVRRRAANWRHGSAATSRCGHAAGLIEGLLSGLERNNCWTIAEHRGHSTPGALQHLLSRAAWDADAVRDEPARLRRRTPRRACQRLSAGTGSKGQRLCSWARVALLPEHSGDNRAASPAHPPQGHHRRAGVSALLVVPPDRRPVIRA
jgi:hypothetical protein